MSLSNEQLILLDALTYYSAFSDINSLPSGNTVADVIDYIETWGKTTCFNGIAGLSDDELGMGDIIEYIKNDSKLMQLEIIYPNSTYDMTTTASVCLIDPETNAVYVIFGGNYGAGAYEYNGTDMGTWADNFIGAFAEETEEQKRALDFYKEAVSSARDYFHANNINVSDLDITVSGHSAAGNLAQYVTVMYNGSDNISRCVSVDGQGFSQKFIDNHSYEIAENASKITSILPSTSIVGPLMYKIPGAYQLVVDIDCISQTMTQINSLESLIKTHMPIALLNELGNLRDFTTPSDFSLYLNDLSKKVVSNLINSDKYNIESVLPQLRHFLICFFDKDLKKSINIEELLNSETTKFVVEAINQLSDGLDLGFDFNANYVDFIRFLIMDTVVGDMLTSSSVPNITIALCVLLPLAIPFIDEFVAIKGIIDQSKDDESDNIDLDALIIFMETMEMTFCKVTVVMMNYVEVKGTISFLEMLEVTP